VTLALSIVPASPFRLWVFVEIVKMEAKPTPASQHQPWGVGGSAFSDTYPPGRRAVPHILDPCKIKEMFARLIVFSESSNSPTKEMGWFLCVIESWRLTRAE
jgi:hypothetical protein